MKIGDISYKDYRKKDDIHGSILYPAVMVAPIQKTILQQIIKDENIECVFDPFHGSGTSLYEALEISDELKLIGCDINPLANLITKVKLQGVNKNIDLDIQNLKQNLEKEIDYNKHSFKNIDKWFRKDIIESLSLVRHCIMKISDEKNRLYFWYILCDIIRKYSNTRSSTYKLHIKKQETIDRMRNRLIEEYIMAVEENVDKFYKKSDKVILYKCDVLDKIKEFGDETIDISITSPPYGDNATTVTYGQFSILPLFWIDKNDLELEGWEFNNFSKIDSKSLGGKSREIMLDDFESALISPYINKICESKKEKVIRFFDDYFIFLKELTRVTSKYIVMTLGNRTVDGININLTSITQEVLEHSGFKKNQLIERKIPSKRIPKKTSKVNDKPVNSMNYEYVIIYSKN